MLSISESAVRLWDMGEQVNKKDGTCAVKGEISCGMWEGTEWIEDIRILALALKGGSTVSVIKVRSYEEVAEG